MAAAEDASVPVPSACAPDHKGPAQPVMHGTKFRPAPYGIERAMALAMGDSPGPDGPWAALPTVKDHHTDGVHLYRDLAGASEIANLIHATKRMSVELRGDDVLT